MRIGLPAALAAVVLSCGLSAPAQATQSFSFSYGNPLTLTLDADYWGAGFYVSQGDTANGDFADASYSMSMSYLSARSNKHVNTYSYQSTVPFYDPKSETIYGVSEGDTVPFFVTFTSLTAGKSFDLSEVNAYLVRHGSPQFLDFAIVPSVPEPSTWMMMIAGFAMVGGTARARYRQEVIRA
jgi:hypothetical protein